MTFSTLGTEEFESEWRPLHGRIFSGVPPEDGPFVSADWRPVLLSGGLLLSEESLRDLREIATRFGDTDFVVVDADGSSDREPPVRVPWELTALEEVHTSTFYGHVNAHCFGHSGVWGLASSPEGFGVLGGTDDFTDAFVGAVGGEQALFDRFHRSVEAGDVSFGAHREPLVHGLLEMVGWSAMKATVTPGR